ncbi:S8 family serine peptidase [Modestobacter roseus]|uniref:LGFP repeat-containing protein n=1 Tax=Modestobacter roseus TaxID=1181884 RepID=A0A562IUN5_9ACTN|nr:S8 family serine peptidase [Modestobacter roseus]MQA33308.1 S8 family serine peptidase [Modestobacter roseus]TWH74234.1 LGFP repeat-containing protein [Modestobacter roseus]
MHRPARGRLARALTASVGAILFCVAVPGAAAAEEQTTVDVLRIVDGEYVVETLVVSAPGAEATADRLTADPGVVAASPQVTYRTAGTPDPAWEADDPGAVSDVRSVWPRTRGAGQVVAVLDDVSALTHMDFSGAETPGKSFAVGGTGYHGTAVASVVAARADNGLASAGMAPEAGIMPVQVCGVDGCSSAAVARGILWATDQGADVINMSFAGPDYSDVTAAAVQYALDHGVSVVAAAGNDAASGAPIPYPAALNGVIAVSATTAQGVPAPWAVHGWQVDLSTVGEGVFVALPAQQSGHRDGTSFSAPAIAGTAALLRAAHPGISPARVQAALQAGASAGSTWDRAYGAGRLDVPAAFAAADRTGAAPTVTPSSQAVDVTWAAVPGATAYTVRVDGVVAAQVGGTGAHVAGLVDGTQVAVDVQPDGGARSQPSLATVGAEAPGAPVVHSAALRGSSADAFLDLQVSVAGMPAAEYSLIRDGVTIGSFPLALTGSATLQSLRIGAMPTGPVRWQLRGVDGLGRTSVLSEPVSTGAGQPAAPRAVTGLTARIEGDHARLTWTALGDGYRYRVRVDGGTVATPRSSGVALDVPPAHVTRTYEVSAIDAWDQVGPATTVDLLRTRPSAPTGVSAQAGTGRATVWWTPALPNGSAVTGYAVTAAPGGATVTTTGATNVVVPGLDNGTAYTFTVTATNDLGTSPASVASSPVTPIAVPGVPTAVTAVAHDGSATVSWTAPATGGPVERYLIRSPQLPHLESSTSATTLLVEGLTNGVAYTFRVRAVNIAGTGPDGVATAAVTPVARNPITLLHEQTGGDAGPLGPPRGAEVCGLRDGGCLRPYARGTVYWSPDTGAHPVSGGIASRWAQQGWEFGPLGYPVTPPDCQASDGTCVQEFEGGTVVAGRRGAWAVTGKLESAWYDRDAEFGDLGFPVGEQVCGLRAGGCLQRFDGGSLYSSPASGVFPVLDPVAAGWARQGWESGPLGYPVTDMGCQPGDGGCFQHFQGGTVMWSPSSGAWPVSGALRDGWFASGSEAGRLRYPTSGATCGLRNGGCLQRFQGGALYWSPRTGAHAVTEPMSTPWARWGWEFGLLGYPVSGMGCGLAGGGCYQHFEGGTLIGPAGALPRVVSGPLRDRWFASRSEAGPLGHPAADPVCGLRGGGCWQAFAGGAIYWSPSTGAWAVSPPFLAAWASQGWEGGWLGYPVSAATCVTPDQCQQLFEHGTISRSPSTGIRFTRNHTFAPQRPA